MMLAMEALDDIDLRIVALLERDVETSYPTIADQLGVSLTTVYNRIRRLKRMGVIKKIVALVNYEKLGYGISALVGISANPRGKERVLGEFRRLRQVRVIYEVTGRYDYMLEIRTRDTDELRQLLTVEMGRIDGVQRTETMVIIHRE